jgi:leucyl aminopeptidase
MKFRVCSQLPSGKPGWTVRFVPSEERRTLKPEPTEGEFSAEAGSVLVDRSQGRVYAGVGKGGELSADAVRRAAGAVSLRLRRLGHTRVAVEPGVWLPHAQALAEGFVLGGYRFERFLPKQSAPLEEVAVVVSGGAADAKLRKALEKGRIVGEAVNAAREVANTPGNLLYPASLAAHAVRMAKAVGLSCKVLDEKDLEKGGFGGILAVGSGSARPPRLIVLEHRGGEKKQAPLALVGKAITFDSGGISIKPAANMEDMIFDKCGGMAVLGAMEALARLKVPRHVVGVLACAENMPSATAYRPGDIVRTYSGVHVEVVNTDAEGRMVLADALAWVREKYRPEAVVDLATLTGACGVALGDHMAGLWSNHAVFLNHMSEAACEAGERVWPMPLDAGYARQIKSDVAQIKNSGGRLGGACTAAAFLKVFADPSPWAHLDIAYTAHSSKDSDCLALGATGYGVRTLIALAERGSLALGSGKLS